ncbi:MAG: hypothetical protein A2Y95_09955 [Deltaproteobacteria bacterium RBG_13_65_10]|nr:MAG: hypothetical protein A2Y95_09955 [Deltaproteobacteria bacterium RBG_13_65_10]
MKRGLHTLVLTVAIFVLLVGAALAKEFTGKVGSVDAAAGKLSVKKMMILKKNFTAESSALEGIAKGDKVTVTYEKEGDTNKASKVEKK